MKVLIRVKGENDIKPIVKVFEYQRQDEGIFFSSIEIIKNKVSKNQKLNINETLALFAAFVVTSINEDMPVKEIRKNICHLVLPNQVLIGVPELLSKLTFIVTTEHISEKELAIEAPIPLQSFKLAN